MTRLRAAAKARAKSGEGALERWWSTKYGLPANHALFTSRSQGDLILEMLSDMHLRREALKDELREGAGTADVLHSAKVLSALRAIEAALGEQIGGLGRTGDPLFDRWEAALEAGQTPNLRETIAELRARGEL